MRLVLRVMAASALMVMAYATQVSAQTGFANMSTSASRGSDPI